MKFIRLLGPSESQDWKLCHQKRKTRLRLLLLSVSTDTSVHQQQCPVPISAVLQPCMTFHSFAGSVIGMAASFLLLFKNTPHPEVIMQLTSL